MSCYHKCLICEAVAEDGTWGRCLCPPEVSTEEISRRLPPRPKCPDCGLESLTGTVHEDDCVQMAPPEQSPSQVSTTQNLTKEQSKPPQGPRESEAPEWISRGVRMLEAMGHLPANTVSRTEYDRVVQERDSAEDCAVGSAMLLATANGRIAELERSNAECISLFLHEQRVAELERDLLSQVQVNKVLSDEVLIYIKERDEATRVGLAAAHILTQERDRLRAALEEAEEVIWAVAHSGDGSEHGNNQYIAKAYIASTAKESK